MVFNTKIKLFGITKIKSSQDLQSRPQESQIGETTAKTERHVFINEDCMFGGHRREKPRNLESTIQETGRAPAAIAADP